MQLSMRRCNPLPRNTNQVMCYVYLMVTSICSLVHICHFTWGQVIQFEDASNCIHPVMGLLYDTVTENWSGYKLLRVCPD